MEVDQEAVRIVYKKIGDVYQSGLAKQAVFGLRELMDDSKIINMEVGDMRTVSDIYGGNYLSAALVKSERLEGKSLVIKSSTVETIREKEKILLSFNETGKELLLNKTNAQLLSQAFGEDYTQWPGKRLMIKVTRRMFQGTLVDAIEVVPQ